MREKIDGALILGQLKLQNALRKFANEEKGASEMVVVIVLIVIVIAIAVIFRDKLQEVVEKVFNKLDDFINTTKTS